MITKMGYKLVLFGILAVVIQSIAGQCIGNALNTGAGRAFGKGALTPTLGAPFGTNQAGPYGPNRGYNGIGPLASSPGILGCAASTGGNFAVTSGSPIIPTGVSVLSENLAIEGPLSVGGSLPFLGTVGLEGAMPADGAGSVSYGCGNGNIGIVSESAGGPFGLSAGLAGTPISTAPLASSFGIGPVVPTPGPYGLASSPGIGSPLGLGSAIGGSRFGGLNGRRI